MSFHITNIAFIGLLLVIDKNNIMNITIKPLLPDLLDDFLFFFDHAVFTDHPDWSVCYCYSFHFTGSREEWNRESNRSSAIQLINAKKMTGYLAYSNDKPVGWCNVNNRLNYQRLLKYYELSDIQNEKVCSIVCFLIDPEYRRKGIAQKLLDQIVIDYSYRDYDYIEAYPGKNKLSCEDQYMGPLGLYKKYGFKILNEYSDYYVVRKYLNIKNLNY